MECWRFFWQILPLRYFNDGIFLLIIYKSDLLIYPTAVNDAYEPLADIGLRAFS